MRILIGLILILCFTAFVKCEIFFECNGKQSKTYVARYRKNDDCRSFIYCDGEDSFEDQCSLGLAFNLVDLTCDFQENVYCGDDIDDIEMENNVSPTKSSANPAEIVTATKKQHPTPPGRPLNSKIPTSSPIRPTPKGNNSKRPVPTRKPSLGSSSTLRSKSTSISPIRTKSPTRKNTSISPNRPSPPAPVTKRPKTSVVPTRIPTKLPSPIRTESPIQDIPTPPGAQILPNQSKVPVSTTLPKKTEPTLLPTEQTSIFSSTKSYPKTKVSSSSTTSLPTTRKYQTELLTSTPTTDKNEITLANIEEQCKKKKVGNFEDPDDCNNFYRCMKGVLNKQECPKGLGWDANSKMCTSKGCLKK